MSNLNHKKIINAMKSRTAPWLQEAPAEKNIAPFNPYTGAVYSSVNRVLLSMAMQESDRLEPRFVTQAGMENLAMEKPDQNYKGVSVASYVNETMVPKVDPVTNEILRNEKGEDIYERVQTANAQLVFKPVYHVAKLEQVAGMGIEQFEHPQKNRDWSYDLVDRMIENTGLTILHDQDHKTFYKDGFIHAIPKEAFPEESQYYSALLKPLVEATSRDENGKDGSLAHALHEFRMQVATWELSQDLGLDYVPERDTDKFVSAWVENYENSSWKLNRDIREADDHKNNIIRDYLFQDSQREQPVNMAKLELWRSNWEQKDQDNELTIGEDGTIKANVRVDLEKLSYQEYNKLRRDERPLYDPEKDTHFVPADKDIKPFVKWLPTRDLEFSNKSLLLPEEQFSRQFRKDGLVINSPVIMDGEKHFVPLVDSQKDGWYKITLGQVPKAEWENRQTNISKTSLYRGDQLDTETIDALKEDAKHLAAAVQQEKNNQYDQSAIKAQERWEKASAEVKHPLVEKWGLDNIQVKQSRSGELLIPLMQFKESDNKLTLEPQLRSLANVTETGRSWTEKGCQLKGSMVVIDPNNEIKNRSAQEIILVPDFVEASVINKASGLPTVATVNSQNMEAVALSIRQQAPSINLIICAPVQSEERGRKTQELAEKLNAKLVTPVFTSKDKLPDAKSFLDVVNAKGQKSGMAFIAASFKPAKAKSEGLEL